VSAEEREVEGPLTDVELTALVKRYTAPPPRSCPVCGALCDRLGANGGGRMTRVCPNAESARPFDWKHYEAGATETQSGDGDVARVVAELRVAREQLASVESRERALVAHVWRARAIAAGACGELLIAVPALADWIAEALRSIGRVPGRAQNIEQTRAQLARDDVRLAHLAFPGSREEQ
jgi:hypothetical protein